MGERKKKRARAKGTVSADVPDKLYFRIGEASKIAGVESYVLRFWEREFPMLKPAKTKTNQRRYKRQDIELILEIRRLLSEEKFTIEGARKYLSEQGKKKDEPQQLSLNLQEHELRDALGTVKGELGKIKAFLKNLEL